MRYAIYVFIILFVCFLLYRRISFEIFKSVLKSNIPKKNIGIITLETRDMEMNKYHNKSFEKYAKKHGYDYIFLKRYDSDLPVYWQKLEVVLDFLKNHKYDYVMWADSDSIVKNYDIPIESILNKKDIYIGPHWMLENVFIYPNDTLTNSHMRGINAGVFIIKNSDIGISYLENCLDSYIENKNCYVDGKLSLNSAWAGECYEQYVMDKLIKNKYKDYFSEIPTTFLQNQYNISTVGTDCVILHLYGKYKNLTTYHLKNII